MLHALHARHWLLHIVAMACLLFILPVYSLAQDSATSHKIVEMEYYTVEVNLDSGWNIYTNPNIQAIKFTRVDKKGSLTTQSLSITIFPKDALKMYGRAHSERWVADSFRRFEESDMIAQGVMKGDYKLKNVEKGELDINGKHLYSMKYKNLINSNVGYGFLYLYFPITFNENGTFYAFHHYVANLSSKDSDVDMTDFYSIIKGFHLRATEKAVEE